MSPRVRRRLGDMVALERWGGVRVDEERRTGHEREGITRKREREEILAPSSPSSS